MFDCVWKAGPTKDLELFLMIVLDVTLEVFLLRVFLGTMRTLMRPLTQVNPLNMPLEVTILRELLGTMRTLERFLLGVTSDVYFKVRGKLK